MSISDKPDSSAVNTEKTRMHSSRMRTARQRIVSRVGEGGWGVGRGGGGVVQGGGAVVRGFQRGGGVVQREGRCCPEGAEVLSTPPSELK